MKFSILHISDLHRDLTNQLGNAPLLESLVRDVEQRYSTNDPPITKPVICIVSGDLVYGAKAGSPHFAAELTRQYNQAIELLVGIADGLFEGDRQRVVLVPGNHDFGVLLHAEERQGRRLIQVCTGGGRWRPTTK
jgi:3',5'-cyclic AMP phosphodiesterase CpdA